MLHVGCELAVQGVSEWLHVERGLLRAVLVIRGEILRGERSGVGVVWREGWAGGP